MKILSVENNSDSAIIYSVNLYYSYGEPEVPNVEHILPWFSNNRQATKGAGHRQRKRAIIYGQLVGSLVWLMPSQMKKIAKQVKIALLH